MSELTELERQIVENIAESIASTGFLTKKQARAYVLRHPTSPFQVDRETAAEIAGVAETSLDDRYSEAKNNIENSMQALNIMDAVVSQHEQDDDEDNRDFLFPGFPQPQTSDNFWSLAEDFDPFEMVRDSTPEHNPYEHLVPGSTDGDKDQMEEVVEQLIKYSDKMPVQHNVRVINPVTGNELMNFDPNNTTRDTLEKLLDSGETVESFSLTDPLDEIAETIERVEEEYEETLYVLDPYEQEDDEETEEE